MSNGETDPLQGVTKPTVFTLLCQGLALFVLVLLLSQLAGEMRNSPCFTAASTPCYPVDGRDPAQFAYISRTHYLASICLSILVCLGAALAPFRAPRRNWVGVAILFGAPAAMAGLDVILRMGFGGM